MEKVVTKPDSDFLYRIVSGYDGRRLTWHTMECATGRKAKYGRRTADTPEARREAVKAKANVDHPVFASGYGPYYTDHMAQCCTGKPETASTPSFTTSQARRIFAQALTAGKAAGNAVKPTPMVVGTPTTFLGSDIDYSKRTYYASEGACGFAWVVIRPGNSSLARRAVKLGLGRKAYGGGVSIWVGDHGQSVDRNENHAAAYAEVLRGHGVNAYSQSRLD